MGRVETEHEAPRNIYRVTVRYSGRQMAFTYEQSISNTLRGAEPHKSDILRTVAQDYRAYMSERSYGRHTTHAARLARLFTPDDMERLRAELEHIVPAQRHSFRL